MANYHPDLATLTEFSAGALSPAVSACVSAHLEFCVQCRSQVAKLNSVGGELLEQAAAASLQHDALEHALSTIDALPLRSQAARVAQTTSAEPASAQTASTESGIAANLPTGIRSLIASLTTTDNLHWNKLSASLSIARLIIGDADRELALHRLRSGGGVANHNHRAEEVTVVLCGSFSDQNGLYMPGDFLVKQPGETHSPKASVDGDCICLSAMAGPVKFTGWLARLINPFLKIKPSISHG